MTVRLTELGVVISVDMGKRCAECGSRGATDSGICLACSTRALKGKHMRSREGQVVQKRFHDIMLRARST